MELSIICEKYKLGHLLSAAPLNPGTVARVWELETTVGRFLLRTLAGKEQGEREWSIHRHLLAKRFDRIPAVILTAEGAPFLEMDGLWYQVQEFLPGRRPDPAAPGVPAAMARMLKELARCMPDGMIHGDLGPWNMIWGEDGAISVIDFGAVRRGDPYFDFAAAFGGVINHTSTEERVRVCGEFLKELGADRGRLLEQLRLWAAEGVARWSGHNEKMAARFGNALRWAEENIYEL